MAHTSDTLPDGSRAPSPDLILLDGGAGHVSVISQALDEHGYFVPVFGMVKDEHHKTRTLVSADGEIDISKQTDIFRFVYLLQEEVHRYTVGRMSRAKRRTLRRSSLENIPGIGPAKAKRLLSHLKTFGAVKNADIESLAAAPGISQSDAATVYEYFHKDEK